MNIFKYPFYALLAFMLLVNVAEAKVTKLTAADRAALEQGSNHPKMILLMKNFPTSIIQICATATSNHDCRLADPGEDFQTSETILGAGLPKRRLIWGAHIPGYYIIHYEAGGRERSYHIIVIAYDAARGDEGKIAWRAISDDPLPDYDAFLAALATDKLDDTLSYSF